MTNYKLFNRANTIAGWATFAIAAIVYLLTIEPTASFWDCGEFIASGYKLEVGHPPGAPFFMLLTRFFTLFASKPALASIMVNSLSALASAFTILFLFWTITHLARKFFENGNREFHVWQLVLILGAGAVGALAYTFSDTFWFSAVEGEVYATSSLFTALVFWAILKWEDMANEPHANRWLILIAYLMGLSIGVHLLNLLAIPAIVMVYFFKKYEVTPKGIVYALGVSLLLLIIMMYAIIQGVIVVASQFELFFVNSLGLPYSSGFIFLVVLTIALIVWGIRYSIRKSLPILNSIIVGLLVILLGYSSFAIIVIRSAANPPMDQNSPDNMFSLLYYLNREQYGDRPLITGPSFNAPVIDRTNGSPVYISRNGKYEVVSYKPKFTYDERFVSFFPRMYSQEENHVSAYKEWTNFKGRSIRIRGAGGEQEVRYAPTFGENLRFFFSYQMGHMYWRYFMWNFAGRQNDFQGNGEIHKGNWISGIPFIDNYRLGPQNELPSTFKNKAHNRYFLLPLLLGLAGLLYQFYKKQKDFWVVTLLFVLTGIAIVVYLNQTPYQPRERDYAYAGSFYAFAIWIGLGVLALFAAIRKLVDKTPGALIASGLSLIFVPSLMAYENWDDHDRSGRYVSVDFAYNALNTCEPNSILFTYGDNDTFPLWYAQEVEGIRTDVRVSNLSYLRADWYIDQMLRKAYQSDPLPVSMKPEQYVSGTRDVVIATDRITAPINVKQAVNFLLSDNPETRLPSPFERGAQVDFIPSKSLFLPIDKGTIIDNKVVRKERMSEVVDTMRWRLPSNYLMKDGIFLMDLMANNNWERAAYFSITVSSDTYQGLDKYFQVEGLTYRIVPIEVGKSNRNFGKVDTDIMYNNLMNVYRYRSISDPKVYIDENHTRIISNYRNIFGRLAMELAAQNRKDSAEAVLDRCMEVIPLENIPLNYFALSLIEGYYKIDCTEKAAALSHNFMEQCTDELVFFLSLPERLARNVRSDIQINLYILQELHNLAQNYSATEHRLELEELFNALENKVANAG